MQEPFRWIGDVATIQAFESGLLDMRDFYFTGDDYHYRIEVEAKRRFLESLKSMFNSGVKYTGKTWKWDAIILNKVQELNAYILGKTESIDFGEPAPRLHTESSLKLCKRILGLTLNRAYELGINKTTLWYLRQRAQAPESFRMYKRVRQKLMPTLNQNRESLSQDSES